MDPKPHKRPDAKSQSNEHREVNPPRKITGSVQKYKYICVYARSSTVYLKLQRSELYLGFALPVEKNSTNM